MWLAICEAGDRAGLWAVAGLRHLGVQPLEVVTPGELVAGSGLVHRVGSAGASVELTLDGGRTVHGDRLAGVLNRMVGVPAGGFDHLSAADRDYVADEVEAALVSWLAGLGCPVVNRPVPGQLCGPVRDTAGWRWLAGRVGLPALPWVGDDEVAEGSTERSMALVVGSEVLGRPPAGTESGCAALATACGASLLGISFVGSGESWAVDAATPLPDLRPGGPAALEALGRALGAST